MARDRCELLCLDLPKAEQIRAGLPDSARIERVARRVKALSDPTRLTLVVALGETDELCVCDLAWIVGRAENLVSHHLRVLRSEGLVTSRRDGKMVFYGMTEAGRSTLAVLAAEEARV